MNPDALCTSCRHDSSRPVALLPDPNNCASETAIVCGDERAVVRGAVRRVLEAQPDLRVAAEATDVASAVRKVLGYKPAVLVFDPDVDASAIGDVLRKLVQASPTTRIVVLAADGSPRAARAAMRAGASAFVPKVAAARELVDAVPAAAAGRLYLCPELGAEVLVEPDERTDNSAHLSPRELGVLRLVALGYTNREIAARLQVGVRTVECHRVHAQRKTHTRTRAQAWTYAREHRFI